MRKTQCLAGTFLMVLALLPVRLGGQERPATQELGAIVPNGARLELGTKSVTLQIAMRADARAQTDAAMSPSSKSKIALVIEGISYDKTPDVYYEVYVGLPKNEKPNYKSPYFVGNLALFQPASHVAEGTSALTFDITRTVRTLKSFKSWNDAEVSVTFILRGLVDDKGRQLPVAPGVRLRFSNVKIVVNSLA